MRSVACGPLILSFSLYIADGVACVKSINAINYGDVGYGFTEDPVGSCWIDPAYGDLRPVLIVRTSISLDKIIIGRLSRSWMLAQAALTAISKNSTTKHNIVHD